jgi:hypothetical protein
MSENRKPDPSAASRQVDPSEGARAVDPSEGSRAVDPSEGGSVDASADSRQEGVEDPQSAGINPVQHSE